MNVLFMTCAPPQNSVFITLEKRPPLGLGILMSIVREKGHQIFFCDNYLFHSNQFNSEYLILNKIDFVAIYVSTICFESAKHLLISINQQRIIGSWKGRICVGGPHAHLLPETFPDFVDHIVIGEGDEVINDIIEGKITSRIITTKRLKNLDNLPFQPWDIFSKLPYNYSIPWDNSAKKVYTFSTSRGCPYRCTFCSATKIWGFTYTQMSADRIIKEILFVQKNFGVDGIYFREDNFTADKSRLRQFCNYLVEKNMQISWACESRINSLDEELIILMKDSGCKAIYMGIESGSQRMLNKMNKKESVKEIVEISQLLKKYGVKQFFSMLFGLPEENIFDYVKTIYLLKKLNPDNIGFSVYIGQPGSPLYRDLLNNNKYEFIDELGLIYCYGFIIKYKFFFNIDPSQFIHHKFKKKTLYDLILSILLKFHVNNDTLYKFKIREFIRSTFSFSYDLGIVDKKLANISINDNSNLLITKKSSKKIIWNFDEISSIRKGFKEYIKIIGWAFNLEHNSSDLCTYLFITDKGEDIKYYNTIIQSRPDVTNAYLSFMRNFDRSGFMTFIPKNTLKNKVYYIGIVMKSEVEFNFVLTNYVFNNSVIEQTNNS